MTHELPSSLIAAVYADGGVIRRNPSDLGGTWAYCYVSPEGVHVVERSGVLVNTNFPGPLPMLAFDSTSGVAAYDAPPKGVTNNATEFYALMRALRGLPEGWSGRVYSDSQITLGRIFEGWACTGLPDEWVRAIPKVLRRLGDVRWTLLDGHPTKAQLAENKGSRGHPVSEHNVWCDEACGERGKWFKELVDAYHAKLNRGSAPCPNTSPAT